jgi:very-short-patch-repair endonuclease
MGYLPEGGGFHEIPPALPLRKGGTYCERHVRTFLPLKKGGQEGFKKMIHYEKTLKPLARRLRSNMTDAEQKLWHHLRRKQIGNVQFFRQKTLGHYIVDFYAPSVKLIVEVDGSQHFEVIERQRDEIRDVWLRGQGLRVLRFDNLQVLHETGAVLECIAQVVDGYGRNQRG